DKILNMRYRKLRNMIGETLSLPGTYSTNKSEILISIIKNLWNIYDAKELALNKRQSLLASYIHMFINRLFDTNQRKYEYALYHLLSMHYRAQEGRNNILTCHLHEA